MRDSTLGLSRYIATVQTSKHRFFVFLDAEILPDDKLIAIGLDDAFCLGVLSSRVHVLWALLSGARLGVGNDSVYNKSVCFDAFPLPDASDVQRARIRVLAEELDAHRKRQQVLHPDLTLTGLYNVLERLRALTLGSARLPAGEGLSAKERQIHEQGLVSVLGELHDAIDREVLAAYGWSDLGPALVGKPGGTTPLLDQPAEQAAAEEELLARLVALNAERAAEEARGLIRWLRPGYQAKASTPVQEAIDAEAVALTPGPSPVGRGEEERLRVRGQAPDLPGFPSHGGSGGEERVGPGVPSGGRTKRPGGARDGATTDKSEKTAWPKTLPEQIQAVRALLGDTPVGVDAIAARFTRAPSDKVAELLETLAALGQARHSGAGYTRG